MLRVAIRFTLCLCAALVLVAPASASYKVRWGDTLTGIAAVHGTTVSALARANGLDLGGILVEGTVLSVPSAGGSSRSGSGGGSGYVVQAGDTLSGIAARYGLSVSALARANGISQANLILAGSTLSIPGATAAAVSAPGAVAGAWSAEGSIAHWAAHYGVDSRLVRALAWMESGYQHGVVSPAGAVGVMQVMPDTWEYVETVLIGHPVPRTADGNVRVGTAFVAHLLRAFAGDERRALAAYYQGERAVRTVGLLPESKRYVAAILALKSRV